MSSAPAQPVGTGRAWLRPDSRTWHGQAASRCRRRCRAGTLSRARLVRPDRDEASPQGAEGDTEMRHGIAGRLSALLAAVVLIVGACGPATSSQSPGPAAVG